MTLRQKLDYHYKAFDRTKISPDPLQFLHLFKDENNIEAIGFIASIFAYGNVKQIINTLDKILLITNNHPYEFIINFNRKNYSSKLKGMKHRFYTEEDITALFIMLNKTYDEYGMLNNLFLKFYNPGELNIKNALSSFSNYFIELAGAMFSEKFSPGLRFMFPLPGIGRACKRMNLFMRWMVRKDELDFGIWDKITPDKLVIPVDTHVARICKQLKLTGLKNVSWKMAEEITQNLKKFDANDPVKYDFAICHIGMRKMIF